MHARELSGLSGDNGDAERSGVAPGRSSRVQRLPSTSAGSPLPAEPRARLETSLGLDLGGVRLHDGADSKASAAGLQAHAYTVGDDIHFAGGLPQPDDPFGMHLLAHEVAHTVQQRGQAPAAQAKREVSEPGDPAELEADRFADHIVGGGPMPALSAAPGVIHRQDAGATPAPPVPPDPDAAYHAQVTLLLQTLLRDYQTIPIQVDVGAERPTIAIDIPYANLDHTKWKRSEANAAADKNEAYQQPRPSEAYILANGDEGQHAYRDAELAEHDAAMGVTGTEDDPRSIDTAMAKAKGSVDEIRTFVQESVDHDVVIDPSEPVPAEAAGWKAAIEAWMDKVGIGLDCNGLVFQALLGMQGELHSRPSVDSNNVFRYNDVLDADGNVVNDRRTAVSVDQLGTYGDFIEPLQIKPGDVMMLPGHVRIVVQVDDLTATTIAFTTAESTADARTPDQPLDTGARLHHWKWEGHGQVSHRPEGSTVADWQPITEAVVYKRHLLPPTP